MRRNNPIKLDRVLMHIIKNMENAYALPMLKEVDIIMHYSTCVGAIYATLKRMEDEGLIKSWLGTQRKGKFERAKRYYEITRKGELSLNEFYSVLKRFN